MQLLKYRISNFIPTSSITNILFGNEYLWKYFIGRNSRVMSDSLTIIYISDMSLKHFISNSSYEFNILLIKFRGHI